ncbi:MAG TPA: plastocyanin/azurin family copper-binding protein [Candidatus Eisenbacteria bacterium]|nr:plastocyanin/azurin family copper-binding protein [Candidatus Eisenbacteria bacterium]
MKSRRRWKKGAGRVALALGVVVMLDAPAGSEQGVTIQTFQFKPTPIEVPAGAKVSFTNQDDITHTVTSGTPDSPDVKFRHRLEGKGATATVELGKPGVYPYFCERHRSMRGEIRVK